MKPHKSRAILDNARRIAIVRTDRLGDMVLTLPLARALKSEYPQAEICMVARHYVAPLIEECPAVDRPIYIDDYDSIGNLFHDEQFGAAFFPRPRLDEAAAAFFARVPLRVGTAYRYYSALFNHRVHDHRKTAEHHEAEYNTRLLSSVIEKPMETVLVAPRVRASALDRIKSTLEEFGIPIGSQFIIFHPGSGGSARDLPAESFRRVAESLSCMPGIRIVLTGSENESVHCQKVAAAGSHCTNLCGMANLDELIALVSVSKLLVANSTGVLHIAAALGVPVVGLYPNSPHLSANRWGPYTKNKIILNPPLSATDIDDVSAIDPALVSNAIKNLLGS